MNLNEEQEQPWTTVQKKVKKRTTPKTREQQLLAQMVKNYPEVDEVTEYDMALIKKHNKTHNVDFFCVCCFSEDIKHVIRKRFKCPGCSCCECY